MAERRDSNRWPPWEGTASSIALVVCCVLFHWLSGSRVKGIGLRGWSLAKTDSPAEGGGFELVWSFPVKPSFLVVVGSLFGAGKPFFVPSPAIRFAERAEGVKGPKR